MKIKELFPNEFYIKKDKKMYAEISLENLNKIADCITNLEECCKDKIDKYQEMILKYCELQEKYKKSCETYQQALDETMSEKIDLEENKILKELNVCVGCNNNPDYKSRNEKAIEFILENCIDDEFYINLTNKEKNIIKALDILRGDDND